MQPWRQDRSSPVEKLSWFAPLFSRAPSSLLSAPAAAHLPLRRGTILIPIIDAPNNAHGEGLARFINLTMNSAGASVNYNSPDEIERNAARCADPENLLLARSSLSERTCRSALGCIRSSRETAELSLTPPTFRQTDMAKSELMSLAAGDTVYSVGAPPGGMYGLVRGAKTNLQPTSRACVRVSGQVSVRKQLPDFRGQEVKVEWLCQDAGARRPDFPKRRASGVTGDEKYAQGWPEGARGVGQMAPGDAAWQAQIGHQ